MYSCTITQNKKVKKLLYSCMVGALLDCHQPSPVMSSFAQELCRRTKATVIVPDFALADKTGKHCYPQQPNEILTTRMYFKDAYGSYVLGSDSAGGAIAMSVLLQNSHLFDRAFFISPWLNLECDTV